MARPIKNGLDYFPLDVDIFNDEKVVPVSVEFGIKGEIILIRLLCAIYRNGYFIEWSDMMRYKFAKEMPSISGMLLDSVVRRLVKWRIFDEEMFETHGVLTSRGIQKRYFSAMASRTRNRRGLSGELPYLLEGMRGYDVAAPSAPSGKRGRKAMAEAMEPAPRPVSGNDAIWREEFFSERHAENLNCLCKGLKIAPGDTAALRRLADAVIAEWELSQTPHRDYTDWSRHLISCMRIKKNAEAGKKGKGAVIPEAPPSDSEYDYDGGFGSQDR